MSGVHRGVLLAAGRGLRLGRLTESFPKAMIEVGGIPILHRIISGLAGAGISDLTVITGHAAEVIESGTGDGSKWGVEIRYKRQATLAGTARALSLAREHMGGETFFAGWGDIVVEPSNHRRVVEAGEAFGAAIAVNEVDDPFAGGAVYTDAEAVVTRIVEKPRKGSSATQWNNAGLAVFPASIWPFIEELQPSSRGEYELPQAIAAFVDAGNVVKAVPIEGPWFDAGTPESLAAARLYFGG